MLVLKELLDHQDHLVLLAVPVSQEVQVQLAQLDLKVARDLQVQRVSKVQRVLLETLEPVVQLVQLECKDRLDSQDFRDLLVRQEILELLEVRVKLEALDHQELQDFKVQLVQLAPQVSLAILAFQVLQEL